MFYSYFLLEFKGDRDVFDGFGNSSPHVDEGNRQNFQTPHKLLHSVDLLQVHNSDCST